MSAKAKLLVVGLGPGQPEFLTLRAWEILRSGRALFASSTNREAIQMLRTRGISFEVLEFSDAQSVARLLIEKAMSLEEMVYACPGQAIDSQEVIEVQRLAKDAGVQIELVSSASPAALAFARLVAVMARLRAPDGCPWDAEQTHTSLAIHLLEEAHETLDAIDRNDMPDLKEELGDLLLQVVFHSEIADESGAFEIENVIETLVEKLIHRHPHIFGEEVVSSSRDVLVNWEALKHEQKERPSLSEGIPKNLPALLLANKVQRRVAGKSGEFVSDTDMTDLAKKLFEPELEREVAENLLGELLYLTVAVAQRLGIDPEGALRRHASAALDSAESKTRP